MMRAHRRILATLTLAAMAGAAGCEREASVQATLDDAHLKMQSIAPGGGLLYSDLRTKTFREVSQSLREVTRDQNATPGQVAAAHIMISNAQAGLAGPMASEATTRLNEASGLIAQIRSIAIERGAATGTALVLAAYDPSSEISEVDRAIRETQAELEVARQDHAALEARIASLHQSAAAELAEARRLQTARAEMRDGAMGLDDISAAEVVSQAAAVGREADAHEVAAANYEAEAEMLQPEADQLELRIEGLVAQAAALNKAREGVVLRGQARSASASEAEQRGSRFGNELRQVTSELMEVSSRVAAAATEAAEMYDQAAASATRASQYARTAARAAAGKAARNAAAMRLALANHQLDTAEMLTYLAEAKPALEGAASLSENARQLTADGHRHLQASLESFRTALSDLEAGGASDRLRQSLDETIKGLERRLLDAGVSAGASDDRWDVDPDPMDDPADSTDMGDQVGDVGGA